MNTVDVMVAFSSSNHWPVSFPWTWPFPCTAHHTMKMVGMLSLSLTLSLRNKVCWCHTRTSKEHTFLLGFCAFVYAKGRDEVIRKIFLEQNVRVASFVPASRLICSLSYLITTGRTIKSKLKYKSGVFMNSWILFSIYHICISSCSLSRQLIEQM